MSEFSESLRSRIARTSQVPSQLSIALHWLNEACIEIERLEQKLADLELEMKAEREE